MALFLNERPMDMQTPTNDVVGFDDVNHMCVVDPHLIPPGWLRIIDRLMLARVPLDVCFYGVYDGSLPWVNDLMQAAELLCWCTHSDARHETDNTL